MLFRLIGRLYFWLVIIPAVHRWVTPVICDVVIEYVDKELDALSPEHKARLERARARRRSRSED